MGILLVLLIFGTLLILFHEPLIMDRNSNNYSVNILEVDKQWEHLIKHLTEGGTQKLRSHNFPFLL